MSTQSLEKLEASLKRTWHDRLGSSVYADSQGQIIGRVVCGMGVNEHTAEANGRHIGIYINESSAKAAVERASQGGRRP